MIKLRFLGSAAPGSEFRVGYWSLGPEFFDLDRDPDALPPGDRDFAPLERPTDEERVAEVRPLPDPRLPVDRVAAEPLELLLRPRAL